MMNEKIQGFLTHNLKELSNDMSDSFLEELNKFAYAVVQECIDKIETYRIPVGNSVAGELACEWTYDALKEIRDDIKQEFGLT